MKERYAYDVRGDTLLIMTDSVTEAFVPRRRCDRLRILEVTDGPEAGIRIKVTLRAEALLEQNLLAEAVAHGQLVTGIADFDSVGVTHALQRVESFPSQERTFVLFFPAETDVESAAHGYCSLEQLEGVNAIHVVATEIAPHSWGTVKREHARPSHR